MQHFESLIFANEELPSLKAEKNLIVKLLDNPFFSSNKNVQRKLALYPSLGVEEKNSLICEIMEEIWPTGITNLFSTYKDFEYYITASGKRGHFIHQFEVFLVGLNLINLISGKEHSLNHFNPESVGDAITTWLLTSTVHDFGYPLEVISSISNNLGELYKNLEMDSLSDLFIDLEKKITETILREKGWSSLTLMDDKEEAIVSTLDIHQFISNCISSSLRITDDESRKITDFLIETDNHGYVSAVILCKDIIRGLLKKNSSYEILSELEIFKSLQMAIAAISLHAMPSSKDSNIRKFEEDTVSKIEYDKAPFAYLLYIIDNIQEWSRCIVANHSHPVYQLINFEVSENTILLEYMLHRNEWNDEMINGDDGVINYLDKQREKLLLPKGPSACVGIVLKITFKTNDNYNFDPIKIGF